MLSADDRNKILLMTTGLQNILAITEAWNGKRMDSETAMCAIATVFDTIEDGCPPDSDNN